MPRGEPRPKIKLNLTSVTKLTATNPRGERHYDTDQRGFGVTVFPSGRKVFFAEYTTEQGQRRRMNIGDLGGLTPQQARDRASVIRGDVNKGEDPLAARAHGVTFGVWADEYLSSLEGRKRSIRDDKRYLGEYAKARWKNRPLASITVEDVRKYFESMKTRGNTTANRALASVRACLSAAWREDKIPDNPAMKVKPLPEGEPRDRTLTDKELRELVKAINALDDPYVRVAFGLLLETGCRLSECLRAKWEDFDLTDPDAATWRIPRPKSGKPEVKPISTAAVELLQSLARKGDYVIAGRDPAKPRNDGLKRPWNMVRDAAKLKGVRIHDLRRSVGLWLARAHGLRVASALLGHSDIRVTARHYAREGLGELRAAVEDTSQSKSAKVIPITEGKRKRKGAKR